MRLRTCVALSVLGLTLAIFASCVDDGAMGEAVPTGEEELDEGASTRLALALPPVVELARLDPALSLWPARDADAAVLVFEPSPVDPSHFRAYIVDVTHQEIAFHIDGLVGRELALLSHRLAEDYVAAAGASVSSNRSIVTKPRLGSGGGFPHDPPPDPRSRGARAPAMSPDAILRTANEIDAAIARAP